MSGKRVISVTLPYGSLVTDQPRRRVPLPWMRVVVDDDFLALVRLAVLYGHCAARAGVDVRIAQSRFARVNSRRRYRRMRR